MNVNHPIVRIFEPLLRFFRPERGGRPRVVAVRPPVAERPDAPTLPLPRVPVLRGEDSALVRPYLVAYERREKELEQRARRRALFLAVHGIDVGPLVIHGVVVAR
ncbi:hypothetical protein ACGFRG_15230 [Streptomyces sp. NPDC048696]|uniref:hypothetical protein n=1 Tax=Streptomyces sp. NPDC048696 TaxID=3365585 RepID=UPI00371179E7